MFSGFGLQVLFLKVSKISLNVCNKERELLMLERYATRLAN